MRQLLAVVLLAASLTAQTAQEGQRARPVVIPAKEGTQQKPVEVALPIAAPNPDRVPLLEAEIAALREQVELLNAMLQVFQVRAMPAANALAKLKAESEKAEKAK